MLDVIAIIAVVIALAIAIVLILALTKPDSFRVQRVAAIKAPAETIFSLINDFHRWGSWSPWETRDPAMKRTFSGAESGKGAVYAWDGNKNVGSGRMEILDTSVPSKIVIKLDFFKPFEGHNTAEFTMLPQAVRAMRTIVTWAMHGPASLHVEGDAGVHEFRQDDRQGFRDRPRQSEKAHREITQRSTCRFAANHLKEQTMLTPYLFYNGNCEAAFKFYEKTLGAKIEMMLRNEDAPPDMPSPPERKKKIMHGRISIDGQVLMALRRAAGAFPQAAGLLGLADGRRSGRGRAQVQGAVRGRQRQHAVRQDLLLQGVWHGHRSVRDSLDGQLPAGESRMIRKSGHRFRIMLAARR